MELARRKPSIAAYGIYLEGYRPSVYKGADKRYGTVNLIIGFVRLTLMVRNPGFFYEDAGE